MYTINFLTEIDKLTCYWLLLCERQNLMIFQPSNDKSSLVKGLILNIIYMKITNLYLL